MTIKNVRYTFYEERRLVILSFCCTKRKKLAPKDGSDEDFVNFCRFCYEEQIAHIFSTRFVNIFAQVVSQQFLATINVFNGFKYN